MIIQNKKIVKPNWEKILEDVNIPLIPRAITRKITHKNCLECGISFPINHSATKFCSVRCRNKHHNKKAEKIPRHKIHLKINSIVRVRSINELKRRHKKEYDQIHEEIKQFLYSKINNQNKSDKGVKA